MESLSKVLDEVEAQEQVDFSQMQPDDRGHFLTVQPFNNDRQSTHNVISSHTLAQFLREGGILRGERRQFLIIDCRFPFEFEGGHIHGAVNICSPEDLRPRFFENPTLINAHLKARTILILHCEHSI